jgi:hypothetical protein
MFGRSEGGFWSNKGGWRTGGWGAVAAASFTPTSSQSAAWLARATSVTSNTDKTNYDTMITGLVNDGVWAKLDALWILATIDRTTALLNLVSSSYTCVEHGTVSFSAYHGYTGDGTTFYLDTTFNPSTATTPNFTTNSASMGIYDLTPNTTENASVFGSFNTNRTVFAIQANFGQLNVFINGGGPNINTIIANAQGFFSASLTSTQLGVSASGQLPALVSVTPVAVDLSPFFLFCINSGGPAGFTSDQFSAAFIGGALTSPDIFHLSQRINNYMLAYGINAYPVGKGLQVNLGGYWPLQNSSTWADNTTLGPNLSVTGTPSNTTGVVNNAAAFNGTTDGLFTASNANISAGGGSFSVQAWVQFVSAVGTQPIVGKGGGATSEWLFTVGGAPNKWAFTLFDNTITASTIVSTLNIAFGVWVHLVGTYDSTTKIMTLYVNGTASGGTATLANPLNSGAGNFVICETAGGTVMSAATYVDEVGFWKGRVLSAADVTSLYNGGSGLSFAALV